MSKIREKSIEKIREAYETGQLGFQKGAKNCLYYDACTDSHCAVGVLIGKNKKLMNLNGNITSPFVKNGYGGILTAMADQNKEKFKGLTKEELRTLQQYHDNCVGFYPYDKEHRILEFESYLYSLEA